MFGWLKAKVARRVGGYPSGGKTAAEMRPPPVNITRPKHGGMPDGDAGPPAPGPSAPIRPKRGS